MTEKCTVSHYWDWICNSALWSSFLIAWIPTESSCFCFPPKNEQALSFLFIEPKVTVWSMGLLSISLSFWLVGHLSLPTCWLPWWQRIWSWQWQSMKTWQTTREQHKPQQWVLVNTLWKFIPNMLGWIEVEIVVTMEDASVMLNSLVAYDHHCVC